MKLGKRGRMGRDANKKLAELFLSKGITRCEVCGSSEWLTWAHRRKRRHYNSVEELSDFDQVLLLCQRHHQEIEFSQDKTEALFVRLRG
jgi:hypothetical protein